MGTDEGLIHDNQLGGFFSFRLMKFAICWKMTSKLVVYNFTMNIFKRTVKKVSLLLFLCFIVICWFCNLVKQVITRIVIVNIIIVWDRNWDRIEYVNKVWEWMVVKIDVLFKSLSELFFITCEATLANKENVKN